MISKREADRIEKTTLGGAGGLMTAESEVQRIVQIAMLTLDLKYTEELGKLRQEIEKIPSAVDTKISACREAGYQKRKWNFTAIFTVITATVALIGTILANWRI